MQSAARLRIFKFVALVVALAGSLFVIEVGVRVKDRALFEFRDLRPVPWGFSPRGFAEFDEELGWVPRPGAGGERGGGWSAHADENRFRKNGAVSDSTNWPGPTLLALGNSSAFGDEVNDDETWPAHLERLLGQRVLNAGMSAYGIDQMVLRAERLVPIWKPSVVVLSLFSDDVTRTAFSVHYRWKPIFHLEDDELRLTLPHPPGTKLEEPLWLTALGYTHTGRFLFEKRYPEIWNSRVRHFAHRNHREVSGRLLVRLNEFVKQHDARLFVVFVTGTNADVEHFADLRARAAAGGVEVLDLSSDLAGFARDPESVARMFEPNHHLSDEGNGWVAERIARHLIVRRWVNIRDTSELN